MADRTAEPVSGRAGNLRLLLFNELRLFSRDRKSLFVSLVLPAILLPGILGLSSFVHNRIEDDADPRELVFAVGNSQDRALLRSLIEVVGYWMLGEDDLDVDGIREIRMHHPYQALRDGDIDFLLGLRTASKTQLEDSTGTALHKERTGLHGNVPRLLVLYREDLRQSRVSSSALLNLLRSYREHRRRELLVRNGFPGDPDRYQRYRTASTVDGLGVERKEASRMAPLVLVMLLVAGGAVAAIDSVAGERERGTIELLLASPIRISVMIGSKMLLVVSVSLTVFVMQVSSLMLIHYTGIFDLPTGADQLLTPLNAAGALAIILPATCLIASILIWLSSRSSSYKEAQVLFFPVMLVFMVLGSLPLLQSVSLSSPAILVPIGGCALALRDFLSGGSDPLAIALACLITAGYALLAVRTAWYSMSRRRTCLGGSPMTVNGAAPRPASGRLAIWFAVMWALTFNMAGLAGYDLRLQLFLNLVVVLTLGSLLAIRTMHLRPDELGIRPVDPVWIARAAIGSVCGMLLIAGLWVQLSRIMNPPDEFLRELDRLILGQDLPVWQLFAMVALLPALCEELAFRGVLLGGLRRSISPAAALLLSSLVFSLFHFSVYRFVPTFILGIMLGAALLRSRSLIVPVIWHFVHNGAALTTSLLGIDIEGLPLWAYFASAAILAISLNGLPWGESNSS